jgi:putative nucleotidyltransferase with HDIG domain
MIGRLQKFFERILYRCWQFKQVLFPIIDQHLWLEALAFIPESWRPHLKRLRRSERAHVLRVFAAIKVEPDLEEADRRKLLLLALAHDIGKGVTRHSIFFKVAKVVFPISNGAHCLAGAKLLRKLGAENWLIRMVLRHHCDAPQNHLLKRFQAVDDRL